MHVFLIYHFIIPEPTASSAVPGVSPGRGLLIPHGYLHPATSGLMRAQRSAKFINDCGRITSVHGWTNRGDFCPAHALVGISV